MTSQTSPVYIKTPGGIVVVTATNPCKLHPAFEADYCPRCGTAHKIGA